MLKRRSLTLLATTLLLSGVVFPAVADTTSDYNPSNQSRIRLFGQNGKPTIMTSGIDCANKQKGEKVNVGGGLGDAFGSFIGSAKNKSIGIPETETTKNLSQQNGILSKAMYKEFVIPADKSVNLKAAYIGLTTALEGADGSKIISYEGSCQSNIASFTPQAGHDYEVLSLKQGKNCGIAVVDVISENGGVKLQPVPTSQPVSCSVQ